jgi:hypothetical protein
VRAIEPIGPRPVDPPVPGERSRRRSQGDPQRGGEQSERERARDERPQPDPPRAGEGRVDVRA